MESLLAESSAEFVVEGGDHPAGLLLRGDKPTPPLDAPDASELGVALASHLRDAGIDARACADRTGPTPDGADIGVARQLVVSIDTNAGPVAVAIPEPIGSSPVRLGARLDLDAIETAARAIVSAAAWYHAVPSLVSFDQSTDWRHTEGWTHPDQEVVHLWGDLALAKRSEIAQQEISTARGRWLAGNPDTPIASLIDHEFAHVAFAEFLETSEADCINVVRQICRAATGRDNHDGTEITTDDAKAIAKSISLYGADCISELVAECAVVARDERRTDRLALYLRATLTAAWDRHAAELRS